MSVPGRKGRGLLRPDPRKLLRRAHAAPLLASQAPRGSADLGEYLGPRYDQGNTGTCHAHSGVAAVACARAAKGSPLPWVPSPLLLAATTYADVRAAATPAGQPLPPLQDTGADLSDDATALARWGIGPIQALVPGRYSDVPSDEPGVAFPEPPIPTTSPELVIAGANLIAGEYQIPGDSNAPTLAALVLDVAIPVWVGFFCDTAFEDAGASTVVGAPNQADPNGGGHAVYLSAYRTNSSGQLEFRVENSWGSSWADNGAVWASSAWLEATWMLWPMAVAS